MLSQYLSNTLLLVLDKLPHKLFLVMLSKASQASPSPAKPDQTSKPSPGKSADFTPSDLRTTYLVSFFHKYFTLWLFVNSWCIRWGTLHMCWCVIALGSCKIRCHFCFKPFPPYLCEVTTRWYHTHTSTSDVHHVSPQQLANKRRGWQDARGFPGWWY